ncbi:hypothetical protein ACFLZI_02415 [Nitrospirota bacterium]
MARAISDFYGKSFDGLDAEELDSVNEVLVYILMKNADMEPDEAYSLVFSGGSRITWH